MDIMDTFLNFAGIKKTFLKRVIYLYYSLKDETFKDLYLQFFKLLLFISYYPWQTYLS